MTHLPALGLNLRQARKKRFPHDGMRGFAPRIGVSLGTLQKMEKGDLSVSMASYFQAAKVLGVTEQFDALFTLPVSLFDD